MVENEFQEEVHDNEALPCPMCRCLLLWPQPSLRSLVDNTNANFEASSVEWGRDEDGINVLRFKGDVPAGVFSDDGLLTINIRMQHSAQLQLCRIAPQRLSLPDPDDVPLRVQMGRRRRRPIPTIQTSSSRARAQLERMQRWSSRARCSKCHEEMAAVLLDDDNKECIKCRHPGLFEDEPLSTATPRMWARMEDEHTEKEMEEFEKKHDKDWEPGNTDESESESEGQFESP